MPSPSSSSSESSRERTILIISSTLFTASSWWILKKLKQRSEHQRRMGLGNVSDGAHFRHHIGGGDNSHHGGENRSTYNKLYKLQQVTSKYGIENILNSKVSTRCLQALSPPIPYLEEFMKCLQLPYHRNLNPRGYIPLCMAENKLCIELLAERFMQHGTSTAAFSDSTVYCYNSFLGLPIARHACAYFLAKRFLFPNGYYINANAANNDTTNATDTTSASTTAPTTTNLSSSSGEPSVLTPDIALSHINPSNVVLGSGLASVLNSLFYLLGGDGNVNYQETLIAMNNENNDTENYDPSKTTKMANSSSTANDPPLFNDACLIPAPYYPAFENDMELVANITPFVVHMSNPTVGPTASEFDLAYMEAKSQGLNPRFILLTNPNNPLGIIYSPTIIRNAIAWARKRGLHTIVDEIYALSTHQARNHGFESVIKVMDNQLGNDVHMVWAISKDFGASGLRVGLIYTQNQLLLEGLATLNIFRGVSGPIQMVVSELLTDDDFVDKYLDESRNRLVYSYQICTCKLEEMVIPYVPATAGQFVYIDCTSLLPKPTFEYEQQLFQLISDYAHVVLTPGENQRDRTPGMFRICYAWSPPDVLEIAMERLSRIVAKIRRLDWGDLNETTLREVML